MAELFWVALAIVAGSVALFAARAVFRHPRPRRSHWLPVIAGLALMLPGACGDRTLAAPTGGGWGDTFALDLQRA